jgi:hypothetical protein
MCEREREREFVFFYFLKEMKRFFYFINGRLNCDYSKRQRLVIALLVGFLFVPSEEARENRLH